MKAWVKGDNAVAAKVDPAVGAALAVSVNVLVRFNVHTMLGLSAADLLATLLDIAFVVLTARSIQIRITKNRSDAANNPPPSENPPPAEDPPKDEAA